MNLTIPTNWDDGLIPGLPKDKVSEVYGKLAADFVGGGRASFILPPISRKKAATHIAKIHKQGFKFNYLLNAVCMGNRELERRGQQEIIRLIDWLVKVEVDSVTVSVPFLFKLIKDNFPFLKINVSVQANINSVKEAMAWDELGADKITLSVLDVNRDFILLKKIRNAVRCQLQLIANLKCLAGCPFHRYHENLNSHASQSGHPLHGYMIDYCTIRCNLIRMSSPLEYIKSGWIRPEDICHYEEVGINTLKIVGRQMQTEFILKIANVYAKGRYDGNLLDLLPTHQKSIMVGKSNVLSYLRRLKFFLRPQFVNIFRLQKVRKLFDEEGVYINNRALDGFLNYFMEGKCNFACGAHCSYCNDVFSKSVSINSEYQNKLINSTKGFLQELYCGSMFKLF